MVKFTLNVEYVTAATTYKGEGAPIVILEEVTRYWQRFDKVIPPAKRVAPLTAAESPEVVENIPPTLEMLAVIFTLRMVTPEAFGGGWHA